MTLSNKIKDKLLEYQVGNTENIIRILNNNESVLDASDTGTGKTYTAIASCAHLKLEPIIICPKAVMATWKLVCKLFDVDPFFIVNYETIKNAKYYDKKGNRVKCQYIEYDEKKKQYKWKNLQNNVVFIFDEAHKCASLSTFNGRVHRAGGKSKSLQRIIYTANTIEERIAEKLQNKLKDLGAINNGDLDLSNIVFEKKQRSMD